MSFDEKKAIVRRLAKAMNKKSLTLCGDLIKPDFVNHDLQVKSLEDYKKHESMFGKRFLDMQLTIEDIAEGDKVWIRLKGTATHTGEFRGLATSENPLWTAK